MSFNSMGKMMIYIKTHAVLIFVVALTGILFRLIFIFHQAIYIDEAAYLPGSIKSLVAVTHFPIDTSVLNSTPTVPEFYQIIYGVIGYISNGFSIPQVVHYTYLNYVSPHVLIRSRLLLMIANVVVATFVLSKFYNVNKNLALAFGVFYFLNPVIIFNTSLFDWPSLFIPVMLLLIIEIYDSKLNLNKRGIAASILFGLSVSIQFYGIFFYVLPLLLFLSMQPSISYKSTLKFYAAFTAIAALTILLLNPGYTINPYQAFHEILIATSVDIGTSSGVFGIPIMLFGRLTYQVPLYVPILDVIFETPLIQLIFALIGAYLCSMMILKRKQISVASSSNFYNLVVFASLVTLSMLVFDLSFNLMRRNYIMLIAPLLIVSSFGFGLLIDLMWKGRVQDNSENSSMNSSEISKGDEQTKYGKAVVYLVVAMVIALSFYSVVSNVDNLPVYSNELTQLAGFSGANFDGAWNSPQADMYVGNYIESHGLENHTILTLALTAMVVYYAPGNNYLQVWNAVNGTYLEKNFGGDYVVVDEWYVQSWGNPIIEYPHDFNVIYFVSLTGGYSILAMIK